MGLFTFGAYLVRQLDRRQGDEITDQYGGNIMRQIMVTVLRKRCIRLSGCLSHHLSI